MATYAIGDIHGQLGALRTLLIKLDPEKNRMVFLGDYVDRGPDSAGVLDLLVQVAQECPKCVFLRGNHEWMMTHARDDETQLKYWRESCGGDATLKSYPAPSLDAVPLAHWFFMDDTCQDMLETQKNIYVHGGVNPELPLREQSMYQLHWRRLHEAGPHISGKRVICGHTQQKSGMPVNMGHTVCIDTKDWLTAFNVNDNTFMQFSDIGQWRPPKPLPPVVPVPPPPVDAKATPTRMRLPQWVNDEELDAHDEAH